MLSTLVYSTVLAQDTAEIQIANEYLLNGEKQKALLQFRKLLKSEENIDLIHNDYLSLLIELDRFKEAEDYITNKISRNEKLIYKLDLINVLHRSGQIQKADKNFKNLIKVYSADVFQLKVISDYLMSRNLLEYSIIALQQARESTKAPTMFTLELANLYRITGRRNEMVEEYLSYVAQTPANLAYIKNLLQALLTKQEELEILENVLNAKIQATPNNDNYADLLIWVNLQLKNFNNALLQARAFDRRYKKETSKTFEIAQIASNNKNYAVAESAYRFVLKEYSNSPTRIQAELGLLKTKEARIKETFPINKDSIRTLLVKYQSYIDTYPQHYDAQEALINQAILYAYYLDEKEKATQILQNLISDANVNKNLKAKAKLELGDIYLLNGEPWEASLLYSQVEKTQKETVEGYEAKLRNAKLSYYIGDFKLAEEHLDILKKATTREIANDALDLSIRIKENTINDSLSNALKQYASIELLLHQNKTEEALQKIQTLKESEGDGDSLRMKTSTLLDDIYWLEAELRIKQNQFSKALQLLQNILALYPDDVLADDAYFLIGDIYEMKLDNKAKAMEIFRDFLTKYPGSVYASEARQRFRQLRGDFVIQKQNSVN